MWNKVSLSKIKCKKCCKASASTSEVKTHSCCECGGEFTKASFSDNQWSIVKTGKKKCRRCCNAPNSPQKIGQWKCVGNDCKKVLPKNMFRMWMDDKKKNNRDNTQVCNDCFLRRKRLKEDLIRDNLSMLQKHKKV